MFCSTTTARLKKSAKMKMGSQDIEKMQTIYEAPEHTRALSSVSSETPIKRRTKNKSTKNDTMASSSETKPKTQASLKRKPSSKPPVKNATKGSAKASAQTHLEIQLREMGFQPFQRPTHTKK